MMSLLLEKMALSGYTKKRRFYYWNSRLETRVEGGPWLFKGRDIKGVVCSLQLEGSR